MRAEKVVVETHSPSSSPTPVRHGEVATAVTRRIDAVLVRSGLHGPTLRVADCQRLLDAAVSGVGASDHYGVLADLVVPDPCGGLESQGG